MEFDCFTLAVHRNVFQFLITRMSGQVPRTPEESEEQKMYAELKNIRLEDKLDQEVADEGDRFSQVIPPYQQPESSAFYRVSGIPGCCSSGIDSLITVCFTSFYIVHRLRVQLLRATKRMNLIAF